MKRLIMVVAVVCSTATFARADVISVFVDQEGFSCLLTELALVPANNAFYVIHKLNPGATAAQFKIDDMSGLFPTTQTTPYLVLGTWNVDWSMAYGGCIVGQHVLATLNFLWFGEPTTCENTLRVVAAPTSPIPGSIAVVDCATPANLKAASGGGSSIWDPTPPPVDAIVYAPTRSARQRGVG